MTELPDCLGQNIGLAARTFRAHAGPDMSDRTMWTDSPTDRARKEKVSTRLYMYQLPVLMHLTSIFLLGMSFFIIYLNTNGKFKRK